MLRCVDLQYRRGLLYHSLNQASCPESMRNILSESMRSYSPCRCCRQGNTHLLSKVSCLWTSKPRSLLASTLSPVSGLTCPEKNAWPPYPASRLFNLLYDGASPWWNVWESENPIGSAAVQCMGTSLGEDTCGRRRGIAPCPTLRLRGAFSIASRALADVENVDSRVGLYGLYRGSGS